jgi:hypothetical protein
VPKILIPRLCRDLAAVNDAKGKFYIDNVDVGGVEVAAGVDAYFITGLLNSAPLNFVWKRIAKPFQNGYLSANKQFIAPLPIPAATPTDIAKVSALARRLTELHTSRAKTLGDLERRFEACDIDEKPEEWLWSSEVRTLEALVAKAPPELSATEKAAWATAERAKQVELATEGFQERLRPSAQLEAELEGGELRLKDDAITILDGVFVNSGEAQQVLIDWRNFLRVTPITEDTQAGELAYQLRCIRKTENATLAKQIAVLDQKLGELDEEISTKEAELNTMAYRLYDLTPSEIKLVRTG